jgi:radical SAM protein with 4Fe4S-binding SPASM domain
MKQKGFVLRLYPFLGIAHSLLTGDEDAGLLRCGGGWKNYAIQTDGYIIPCPTMWGMKDYYLGHIRDADPRGLKKIFVDKPCTDCDLLKICGGRCLYANTTQRWNKDAYAEVCNTVRALVAVVENQLPRIRELIYDGTVSPQSFDFLKYNGCEIVP